MITIQINDDEITAAFTKLSARLTDLSPAMQEIAELLRISTKKRIQAGVSPDGIPFAPRSQTTLAAYAARKQTYGGILQMEGTLVKQIAMDSGKDFAEVSSDREYSAVMQFGQPQGASGAFIGKDKRGRDHFHSIPWGNIPARPFIGLSDDDHTGIIGIIEEWLERATP